MSYSDQPRTNWGCIVAGAFLFLIGLPSLFGAMLADVCMNPDGCIDKRVVILVTLIVVVLGTFAIMRLVNIVAKDVRKED